MSEALRRVVAEIESLPDEDQDKIARLLEIELDKQWDEMLESPESAGLLDRMAESARQDFRNGRTKELRF